MSETTLSCSETVRAMWDYVDHALPSGLRSAVEAHLKGCDDCTGHVAFARRLVENIARAPVPKSDIEVLELRVRGALAHEALSAPS